MRTRTLQATLAFLLLTPAAPALADFTGKVIPPWQWRRKPEE